MYVFISRKKSLLILFIAVFFAFLLVFLLNYLFSGPKLGKVYDFFLNIRSSPPVSRDILLIDTAENISSGDVYSIIMALGEMGASEILLEAPVLGMGTGKIEDTEDLRQHISDEFLTVSRNIRALFDAIRFGFVSPNESPELIASLVELSEKGRDRINETIIRQDGSAVALLAQSTKAFGKILLAMDLNPQLDKDGVLRRVAPVSLGVEHIAYHALKSRWSDTYFEETENGLILINSFLQHGVLTEYKFHLDSEDNILMEKPDGSSFRRLSWEYFKNYEQAGRQMAELLKSINNPDIYKYIAPEEMPVIMYDFTENLKEELIQNPNDENISAWIHARQQYFKSLEEFLYGKSEMMHINSYEELIAEKGADKDGAEELENQRNGIIGAFASLREKHKELSDLRNNIAQFANSSFCIIKPEKNDSTAILANTLLTGLSITPGKSLYIMAFSFSAVFVMLALIHTMRPLKQLFLGLGLSFLCGAGFGISFIFRAYWINPLIPFSACVFGTLIMAVSRFLIGFKMELKFRLAYAPALNKTMYKSLVKTGKPALDDKINENAVIIIVKNTALLKTEDNEKPQEISVAQELFVKTFSQKFKKAGAVVLGVNGDTALACFGSPLERLSKKKATALNKKANSIKAVLLVNELISAKDEAKDWVFGIDSGECVFSWSPLSGYKAEGRAVFRAKVFASLVKRFNVKAIISGEVKTDSELTAAKKLAALKGESFYGMGLQV